MTAEGSANAFQSGLSLFPIGIRPPMGIGTEYDRGLVNERCLRNVEKIRKSGPSFIAAVGFYFLIPRRPGSVENAK
jgi:hypothetical protein